MNTRNTQRGFTLMEILIVVLIVGILSAMALPLYHRAVLKSRFTALIPMAKALADGQERAYMEKDYYEEDLSLIDGVPSGVSGTSATLPNGDTLQLGVEENHIYIKVGNNKLNNKLTMYQKYSPNFAGETHCEALQGNAQANWLCEKGLKGTFVGNKFGYAVYSLSEETVGTLSRKYYDTAPLKLDGDICEAEIRVGCSGGTYTNEAQCLGFTRDSCYTSSFNNQSVCIAKGVAACHMSTYRNGSRLIGDSYTAGWESTYYGSSCEGNADSACMTSTFKENSICYANAKDACRSSTYDETSFCVGTRCPTGTPKGSWNESIQTYERDGWNGNCCKASYTVNEQCPANVTVCTE